MSTKIFNGYCVTKDLTFYEINQYISKMREEIKKVYKEVFFKKLYEMTIDIIDMKKIMAKDDFKKYLIDKYDIVTDNNEYIYPYIELSKISNRREREDFNNYFFDYACSIVIYPYENKTLFQLFTNNKEFIDIFGYLDEKDNIVAGKFEDIIPYPYYNNVDMPQNITKEEWNERGKEWNDVLKDIGIPKYNGIIYDLIEKNLFIDKNKLSMKLKGIYTDNYLFNKLINSNNFYTAELLNDTFLSDSKLFSSSTTSFEERLKNKSFYILYNNMFKQKISEYSNDELDYDIYIKTDRNIKSYLKSKDGLKDLEKEKEYLSTILDKNLKIELMEKIQI